MQLHQSKQQLVMVFVAGFLLGIVYANLAAESFSTVTGVFHESFFSQYVQSEVEVGEYFPYLLRYRMLPAVLLGIVGSTKFKKPAAITALLWTGFSGGIVAAVSVLRLGARGMILCAAGMIPQFLFYGLAYAVILWYLYRYPQSEWNAGKTGFVVIMILAGMITEAYLNPAIVKWVLKLIW
ncbi:MAG: stage II sporulation protein M [Bariatricus sp.]